LSGAVELAERFGAPETDGGIDVRLPITQKELASWVPPRGSRPRKHCGHFAASA
jgi:hypothetical protein